NWTMPSEGWDMTNFGLFSGDDDLGGTVARRVYDKVRELRGRKLVMSECGHGYRSTTCEGPNWAKYNIDFEMESSVITMLRYLEQGRIKVDRSKNPGSYTFHDSCNNARSCGLFEEPRQLLTAVVEEFREMYPNRAENFCCTGGGGAMSMAEYAPRRLKSGKIKAEQLAATGADYVVTSCHNCVDGLADLIKHYGLPMKVTQLVNLVANALVIEKKVQVPVTEKVEKAAEALPLEGRTILVVDDEPDVREFLSTLLSDNGARVEVAVDGEQALEKARSLKPDLITLDLSMPGMDGGKFYRMLKEDEELSGTKVCIVTGKPDMRKLIYDTGLPKPEGYMDKPVDEEKFIAGVRKIFETERKN
ncbi:MAG: response regulator, partial [Deltaproteobacteria bacterium]